MDLPPEDDTSSLERLREQLYTPRDIAGAPRPNLSPRPHDPAQAWEALKRQETGMPHRRRLSGAGLFFIGAVVFFVIAGGASFFLFVAGGRSVSTDNIVISVQGPTSIAGGETVPLSITIENRNPVAITDTHFTVDFPVGTRSPDSVLAALPRHTDSLGAIAAGAMVSRTVRAVLFGEENQVAHLVMRIEYRTADSNAVFIKEKNYDLTITTSPLSVSVDALTEVPSGQSFSFSIVVRSNATTPLPDAALLAEYPFGFVPTKTSPAVTGTSLFTLGTLAPGAEKKVTITGTLSGQDGDARAFRFTAGTGHDANNSALVVPYTTRTTSVTIAKPFLAVDFRLNGSTAETSAVRTGMPIQGLLTWTNTLPSTIYDGAISVTLSGDALDKGSVTTQNGFYQSANDTVLFDRDTDRGLGLLEPNDSGNGSFSFTTKQGAALAGLRNPSITLIISIAGRRVSESSVPERVSSTITRVVKVATDLVLTSRAVRTTGPFANSGPWPPVPEQETTYTVLLAVSNTVNSAADAIVSMTLPSYVRFTGAVNPAGGALTYNNATREVSWNIGEVPAGTTARTAAFQVALLPSTSQRGTSPILVYAQKLSGYDRFAQQTIESVAPDIDIETTSDPAYKSVDGTVTP